MYHIQKVRLDARPDVKTDQDSSYGSKGTHRGQTGKARAMRSQVKQGLKASQGASPSWIEGESVPTRKS